MKVKKLNLFLGAALFVASVVAGSLAISTSVFAEENPYAALDETTCKQQADGKWSKSKGCTKSTGGGSGDISLRGGVDDAQGEGQPETLFGDGGTFTLIINVLLFVVGIISVVMLIMGGIKYSTSAGDASKVTSAKNTIMYAIVGLVVAILAYAIVNFVLENVSEA